LDFFYLARLGCTFQNGRCLWGSSGQLEWKRGKHNIVTVQGEHVVRKGEREQLKTYFEIRRSIFIYFKSTLLEETWKL